MKTQIKIKLLLGFVAMFGLINVLKAQAHFANPFVKIVNLRTCDVTVLFEVSDCVSPYAMCSSNGTFIIPGTASGLTNAYIIYANASYPNTTPCSLPSNSQGDVFVSLREIDYHDVSSYGLSVSLINWGGCLASAGTNCNLAPGNIPSGVSCTGACSMIWTINSGMGLEVDIH